MARARRSGRRPDYRWALGGFVSAALAAGSTSQFAFVSSGNMSQTLMRIRGSWSVMLDQGAQDLDKVRVGIGVIKVSGGGTTASTPLTDGDAPWIWFDVVTLAIEGGAVIDAWHELATYRAVIDSKSMRVIRPDEDLVVVMETGDIVGAPNVDVHFDARVLFAD